MLLRMSTRRDFCLTLPALTLLMEAAAAAQEPAPVSAGTPSGTALLQHNHVFRSSELPVKPSATGSSQAVTHGSLPTGEGIEMHNTVLLPGHEPHPPHQHPHAEFLFIREGQVDWLIDGKREPAGPGDIVYAASGVLHGLHNTGTTPAKYFVMAIGPNLRSA